MGNSRSSVFEKRMASLPPEEQAEIAQSFDNLRRVSNPNKPLPLAAFQESIGSFLPSSMCQRIFRGIQRESPTGKEPASAPEISKEQYAMFVADILRGTAEEKSGVVTRMITPHSRDEVSGQEVLEFLEDLIAAVVYVLRRENALSGWSLDSTRDLESGTRTLAAQLLAQIGSQGGHTLEESEHLGYSYTQACIENWLYKSPIISTFLRLVVTLGLMVMKRSMEHQKDLSTVVPKCKKGRQAFCSLLDLPSVMFLNSQLPSDIQHQWRLLYTTQINGESFTRFCALLVDQGPSLLVIRDSHGFIFGGFATPNWQMKPQFQGDSRCFLFTVSPQLGVYTYSGYNDHFMYLNQGQQTMPNGLGMGGQHEYFGLWIDSNFGRGHSKARPMCTTYNSPQLSAKEEFSIDSLEAWGLGDLPEHLLAKNKRSILDSDPEARALLEMTGRARQSDGLRESGEDGDN